MHIPAPTLTGDRVVLRPLRLSHLIGYERMLADPEGRRLTGTTAVFTREQTERWLSGRAEAEDRVDLAIESRDGVFLGEVVLNDIDDAHASANFRISLVGPEVYGRGYGTEAARLLLTWAFPTLALHRVELDVYSYNPRAQRSYEKLGFRVEGVRRDALRWEGEWHDVVIMGMLAGELNGA